MLIAVVNKSTLVTDVQARLMCLAVAEQLRGHVAPAWGMYPPAVALAHAAPSSPRTVVLGLLDDADQAGDLGWHTEDAGGVVYGRVFARPVLDAGGEVLAGPLSVASVLSHEAIETFGDAACDLWADGGAGTLYARELCDAVEGDSYPVSAGGSVVSVSDFLLPAWFDPDAAPSARFDWMGLLQAPYEVRPSGYTITMAAGAVSQVFGEQYPQWRLAAKRYPAARTARRLRQGEAPADQM